MKLRHFGSSLSLPDRVLTFIRDHPLMDRPVFPADGHPLLVTTDTAYLRVVAHRVTSLSGKEYDVLYLGTGIFSGQAYLVHTHSRHRESTVIHICLSPRHRGNYVIIIVPFLSPRGWTPPSSSADRSSAQRS